MDTTSPLFLALDLTGTFAFALNGALTAIRVARLDIVGVVTLGMFTALGGGVVRDLLLDALPPATFGDWRYLTGAAPRTDESAPGREIFIAGPIPSSLDSSRGSEGGQSPCPRPSTQCRKTGVRR